MIAAIIATGNNGEIGISDSLPWKLSDDLKTFKETTLGHAVIMGRKTHESIGRALPDRMNIVITRNPDYKAPGCIVVGSLSQAVAKARGNRVFIIGGAQVYKEAFSKGIVDEVIWTEVDGDFPEADTFVDVENYIKSQHFFGDCVIKDVYWQDKNERNSHDFVTTRFCKHRNI